MIQTEPCAHDRGEIDLHECAAEGCESCRIWLQEQAAEWAQEERREA